MRFRYRKGGRYCGREKQRMKIYAIRGATTVDGDTEKDIAERSVELIKRILETNRFEQAISLTISTTKDVTASYPAKAVRESGAIDVPLFSCAEPDIKGALPLCIRMMLTVASDSDDVSARHVYLRGAKMLRKDLADESV